ncbi:MAG: tetratricopeptide repeat protein [Spirochaetes bacterium]|nr:tetratricopeptide repeat protein [Spirochaetota bacterium]
MANLKDKTLLLLITILLFTHCSTTTRQTQKDNILIDNNQYSYYSMGIIEENQGNIKKAIHYFKKAFNIERSSEIAHEISSCYLQINDIPAAKKYIEKAIQISPNNADHRFMLVNIYLLEKENKKAIDELKKITQIQENNYEAYFDIASIYQNIGNYEKAIHYYNKTLELKSNDENTLYNLGNIYFTLSQKRKAKEYFAEFVKNTDDLESRFIYAYLLALTGEYEKALKVYQEMYKEFPDNTQLLKDMTETFYLMNKKDDCLQFLEVILNNTTLHENDKKLYKAIKGELNNRSYAEKYFSNVVKANENDLISNYGLYKIYLRNKNYGKLKPVLINLGKIFYHNENYQYAIIFFNKHKKLFPKNISPYSYLGIVYESLKQYDKAIIELKNALQIKSEDVKLNYYLGVLFEANKNYKKAINQYNKVIELDKKHLYAYLRLGYLYNSMDQNKKNIATLQRAMKIMPEKPDIYLLLGIGYSRIKKYEQAINTFQKGLELNNRDLMLHFQLASAYDKNNDKENAIKELKSCIKLDNDDPEISNYLAYLYAEENINLKEAEQLINVSLNIDDQNFAYLDTAGWIYYRLNDLNKAKEYLELAEKNMLTDKKYDSVIYEHLVEVHQKLGNVESADKYKKMINKKEN